MPCHRNRTKKARPMNPIQETAKRVLGIATPGFGSLKPIPPPDLRSGEDGMTRQETINRLRTDMKYLIEKTKEMLDWEALGTGPIYRSTNCEVGFRLTASRIHALLEEAHPPPVHDGKKAAVAESPKQEAPTVALDDEC
jgi:hypothetical protein